MNLLFTCAGRRNYLIKFFKKIKDTKIFACDASVNAPALYEADDYFMVPDVYDINYVSILLQEAKKRHINAVIPLNDLELPILAANKSKFTDEGIEVIISDKKIVDLCFDKLQTMTFAENLAVKPIPTFQNIEDALNYQTLNPDCKFIIKPRWGSASFGLEYPDNNEELIWLYSHAKKKLKNSSLSFVSSGDHENCILIQKKLGGQEYGLDVINNLHAEYETTFIRRKLSMRSGETEKAEAVWDNRLSKIGEEIGRKLKHIGILDCDLFLDDDNLYLLEMNPRFGGGYPFSHFAGANLPLAMVEWLKGNKTPPGCFDYENGCISAKVDDIAFINGGSGRIELKSINTMKQIVIIGSGGLAAEITFCFENTYTGHDKDFSIKGYIDWASRIDQYWKRYSFDKPVLNDIENYSITEDEYYVIGMSDIIFRKFVINKIVEKGGRFINLIHPTALVDKNAVIGIGNIIGPYCIIGPNVRLGDFNVILAQSVISHDCVVGNNNIFASSSLCGGVKVGDDNFFGIRSTAIPLITVGNRNKIQAGMVVDNDVSDDVVLFYRFKEKILVIPGEKTPNSKRE